MLKADISFYRNASSNLKVQRFTNFVSFTLSIQSAGTNYKAIALLIMITNTAFWLKLAV